MVFRTTLSVDALLLEIVSVGSFRVIPFDVYGTCQPTKPFGGEERKAPHLR